MIRIMGDRATGKTTALLCQAEELANKHPDKTIYFVSGSVILKSLYEKKVSSNIKFISFSEFYHSKFTPLDYVVVDEIDFLLNRFGIKAYSLTLSE